MKRMNRKTIVKIAVALVLVLGIPLVNVEHRGQSPVDVTPVFKLGGVKLVYGASENWDAVRYLATSAKTINESVETLMRTFSFFLNRIGDDPATYSQTTSYNGQSVSILIGAKQNVSATNSVTDSSNTYKHYLVLCLDGSPVFEIYFDDPDNPGTGAGVLMTYIPYELAGGTLNPNNPYESTTPSTVEFTMNGDVGSRVEYISWSQGPLFRFDLGGVVDNARVKVEETDSGETINFSGVAKFIASATTDFCGSDTNNDWYILTFIVNNSSPYYSTAKFALKDGNIPVDDQICGFANTLKYGLFNASDPDGFVDDNVASGDIPAGYPTAADVDTLFTDTLSEANLQESDIDTLSVATDFTGCP